MQSQLKHSVIFSLFIFSFVGACATNRPTQDSPVLPSREAGQVKELSIVFQFSKIDSRDHAVRFHQIEFIDVKANVLKRVTLEDTSPTMDLGDGWLNTDNSPDVGAFVWAGGINKKADVILQVPAGAEGLLLDISSNVDDEVMEVLIDGETVTTVRVGEEWRKAYVPIGEAHPFEMTGAELIWSDSDYFPEFPEPGDTIFAIRVRSALEDWWGAPTEESWRISDSYDTLMALTLVGMQGVVNRSYPSIYLDWEDVGKYDDAARFWIPKLDTGESNVVELDLDGLSAIYFLWRRYEPFFKGMVVYDPQVPDTINLATMYAGLDDLVILAPEQLALLSFISTDNVEDLRDLVIDQGWDSSSDVKLELYTWVYENLWPDLDKHGIGVSSSGPPTSQCLAEDGSSYQVTGYDPIGMAPRDFFVSLRIPVLWISPSDSVDQREATLFTRFMEEAESPIPVFSFYDCEEVGTVSLASRYGNWVPVITNSNAPLSAGNFSLLSAIRPATTSYESELNMDRIFSTLGQQPVVTLWSSDGDAIHLQVDRGIHGGVDFKWENMKGYRFGWSMNPVLVELAPIIWNYYVESAQGTSFVMALSGAGYAYPLLMDDTRLTNYLEYTKHYMEQTGLRTVWVDERGDGSLTEYHVEKYTSALEPVGLLGIFGTYGSGPSPAYQFLGDSTPIVRPTFLLRPGNGQWILNRLLEGNPGEITYNFPQFPNEGVPDPDDSQASIFTRPNLPPCCMVFSSPRTTFFPGDYEVTFRLKVPDNQSSKEVALIGVLHQEDGGGFLAQDRLSPSDFHQSGQYQDFKISFSIDHIYEDVEVWMDYYGGFSSDYADSVLYADKVVVSREDGAVIPPFESVFIGLVGPIDPLDEDLRLISESQEIAVLHPDEFMFALNPEKLIIWAEQTLEIPSDELQEARTLLIEGQYLGSLIAVREVLKNLPQYTQEFEISASCTITTKANTWIDDIEMHERPFAISFNTHGPPGGLAHLIITAPENCITQIPNIDDLSIFVDGDEDNWSVDGEMSTSIQGNVYQYEITFTQGLHHVVMR